MKRAFYIACTIIVAVLALVILSPFATYDYGLQCDRCLFYEHRAQPRFLGFPIGDYASGAKEDRYSNVYTRIFGHSCEHEMKKSGFGYRGGCGVTAEGSLFRMRASALQSMFEVYKRTGDRKLAQNTYKLIENLLPENATVTSFYDHRRHGLNDAGPAILMLLSDYLDRASSSKDLGTSIYLGARRIRSASTVTRNHRTRRCS